MCGRVLFKHAFKFRKEYQLVNRKFSFANCNAKDILVHTETVCLQNYYSFNRKITFWKSWLEVIVEHFSLLGIFSLVDVSTFPCCSCANAFLKPTLLEWSLILLYMQQRELLSVWKNGQKVNVWSIVIKPQKVGNREFKANVGTRGDWSENYTFWVRMMLFKWYLR